MTGAVSSEPKKGYRPCVGVLLLDSRGHVFVGERVGTPGAWQMPQGGIDEGETPLEAAKRELREEVGTDKAELLAESAGWYAYDLPRKLREKLWGGRFKGQTQKWFAFRFLGSDDDIDLKTHHQEFARWRWMEMGELTAHIVPFKREIYEQVVVEFGHLANGV
ncbi:MAG: RNA pyrophosphohydrolase [Alphaproteobacteria bacterium]|nr:RNA pyrophosphohydrolase [Alphaproteobacteria bacterium]